MKKFKCYSEKKEDYPGFVIDADFPNEIMVCFPLKNLRQNKLEDVFLIIPENEENEKD